MNQHDANRFSRQPAASAARDPRAHAAAASRRGLLVPELLAPAGDWECARAAVENGADAIYFGLERFNARMRAQNFTSADLPKLMAFLRRRGVKGYVTLNTLVFADELAEVEQYLRAVISAGVDAAIVQDAGMCRLIRQLSPDFPIHASTQMTITSAAGVEVARDLGCNLVVLARECSLKEIGKIQGALAFPSPLPSHPRALPLEVFVHGALCVAYSGQCLTSEALGGRSANRGECAQACRLPYELISDGKLVPLGDKRYLLSPQDLAGLELLPELVQSGVASLKIEGRLKSPEYVANITRVYRKALDDLQLANSDLGDSSGSESASESKAARKSEIENRKYEMEMAFSRGLYAGWFRGVNHQELVHARFGKKRGVYLGDVRQVQGERVWVDLLGPLKPGDGVVFDAGRPDQPEEGGRVHEMKPAAGGWQQAKVRSPHPPPATSNVVPMELRFGHGDIDFSRLHAGDKLWKTSDPQLDRRLRQSFAGERPRFQHPLKVEVRGRCGHPMTLLCHADSDQVVEVTSAMPLAQAENQPLSTDRLLRQLGRLGGTPFRLGELKNLLEGEVMLPVSELNRLRREMVSQWAALLAQPQRWTWNGVTSCSRTSRAEPRQAHQATAELVVLVRHLTQLEAVLNCGVQTVYCEFEDPKKYREAVDRFRAWQLDAKATSAVGKSAIFVAPPRIFKMGEEWILKQVRSCSADGYLVRNYDHLTFFTGCRCIGDYSLNLANPLAADYFKSRFALERVTASYDLNARQLEALLESTPPAWWEITIHQHMPMFHMEHCVFCAFLSSGTDYTNCGRPCDRHGVKLRDRVGAEHPLKADVGCRNTVFNAKAQTGAEYVSRLIELGARHFRLEFLEEPPDQVAQTIAQYRQLLRGDITGHQLWRELKLINQLGVTRGPMERTKAEAPLRGTAATGSRT